MRVRMIRPLSGLSNGKRFPAVGEEADVHDSEGATLCRLGYAEPVAVVAAPERAVAPAPEARAPRRRAPKAAPRADA